MRQLRSLPALPPQRCFPRSACLPVTGATQHSHWTSSCRCFYCTLSLIQVSQTHITHSLLGRLFSLSFVLSHICKHTEDFGVRCTEVNRSANVFMLISFAVRRCLLDVKCVQLHLWSTQYLTPYIYTMHYQNVCCFLYESSEIIR